MADQAKKILLEIQINFQKLASDQAKASASIEQLAKDKKDLDAAFSTAKATGNIQEIERLSAALLENRAQTKALIQDNKNSEKQAVLIAQATNGQVNSYEEAYRVLQLRQIQLKTMANTLAVNAKGELVLTDEYKKQALSVKESADQLNNFNKALGDNRSNIGNYAAGFTEAIERTGIFGESISKIKGVLAAGKSGLEAYRAGVDLVKEGYEKTKEALNSFSVTIGESIGNVSETFAGVKEGINDALEEVAVESQVAEVSIGETGAAGIVAGEEIAAGQAIAAESFIATDAAAGTSAVELEAVGAAGLASGEGVAAGSSIGATGLGVLKVALASIGIGLVIIAIGSLVAFFEKSEEAVEGLERKFAGLSSVFKIFVSGAASVGQFFADLFTEPSRAIPNLIDNFKGLSESTKGAVSEAQKLKGAQQDLEDQVRNQSVELNKNNKIIQEALKLSKDQTISAKDRRAALEEAGKFEARNAEINLDQTTKKLDLDRKVLLNGTVLTNQEKERFNALTNLSRARSKDEQEELDAFQKKAKLRDDDLQGITDNLNKQVDAQEESVQTQILINKRLNQLNLAEQKQASQDLLALKSEELKQLQLRGNQNKNLEIDIAREQRIIALSEEGITNDKKQAIELAYQNKVSEIEKEFAAKRRSEIESTSAIEIEATQEGTQRRIDAEILAEQRVREAKLSDLTLTEAQRQRIIADSLVKIQGLESNRLKLIGENNRKEIELENARQQAILKAELASVNDADIDKQFVVRLAAINQSLDAELKLREEKRQEDLANNDKSVNDELSKLSTSTDFKAKSQEDQNEIISLIIQKGRKDEAAINDLADAQDLQSRGEHAKAVQDLDTKAINDTEKQRTDLAQLQADASASFEDELAARLVLLDAQQQLEKEHYANLGLDREQYLQAINLLDQKYGRLRLQAQAQIQDQELGIISSSLNASAALFKKNTTAYKVLATAQALIDTYRSAAVALATYPYPYGAIAAAAAVVTGLANVAKINAIQFADSGKVPELKAGKIVNRPNIPQRANGDNVLATVRTGEVILNEKHQKALGGNSTFAAIGVPGFADSGFAGSFAGAFTSPQINTFLSPPIIVPSTQNPDGLTRSELFEVLQQLNIRVGVDAITKVQKQVQVVESRANF